VQQQRTDAPRCSQQRECLTRLQARVAVFQDTKVQVADILKTGVRLVAGGIDTATDLLYTVVPDSIEKPTVRLVQSTLACLRDVPALSVCRISSPASQMTSSALLIGTMWLT
jgi:hypothetical protein